MGNVNSIESHLAEGWNVNNIFNETVIQTRKHFSKKVVQNFDKQESEGRIQYYCNYCVAFNDTSHNRMATCLNKTEIDHHLKFNYYGISK